MTYTIISHESISRNTLRDAYISNGMYENGSFPFDAETGANLDTPIKRREYYLSKFLGDSTFETQGRFNEDGTPIEGVSGCTILSTVPRLYITVTEDPSTIIEYTSGYLYDNEFKFDLSIKLPNASGSRSYCYDGNYWDTMAAYLIGLGASTIRVNVWSGASFDFLSLIKSAMSNATRMVYIEEIQKNVYSENSIDTDIRYSLI